MMSPVCVGGIVSLGQAEVRDPDDAIGIQRQVRRLDVAMITREWAYASPSAAAVDPDDASGVSRPVRLGRQSTCRREEVEEKARREAVRLRSRGVGS